MRETVEFNIPQSSSSSRRQLLGILASMGLAGCLRLEDSPDEDTLESTPAEAETPVEDDLNPSITFEAEWTHSEALSPLRLSDDGVYAAGSAGFVKLDRTDGSIIWETDPEEPTDVQSHSVAVGGQYVFGTSPGIPPNTYDDGTADDGQPPYLYALHADSGEIEWYVEGVYTSWPQHNPISSNTDYVAFHETDQDNRTAILRVFSSSSGDNQWEISTADTPWLRSAETAIRGDELIVSSGHLAVFGVADGSLRRSREGFVDIRPLFTEIGIVTALEGTIRLLDEADLTDIWTYDLERGRPTAQPVKEATDDRVLFGSEYGLHCLDVQTGALHWEQETSGRIDDNAGGVAVVESVGIAIDDLGFLYALDMDTGTIEINESMVDGNVHAELVTDNGALYISRRDGDETLLPRGTSAVAVSRS